MKAEFKTVEDIRCYHRGLWFHRLNMEFFQTILLETVYQGPGGIYFVTSDKGPGCRRRYSVRSYDPISDKVKTVGEFNAYTRAAAIKQAKAHSLGKQ